MESRMIKLKTADKDFKCFEEMFIVGAVRIHFFKNLN